MKGFGWLGGRGLGFEASWKECESLNPKPGLMVWQPFYVGIMIRQAACLVIGKCLIYEMGLGLRVKEYPLVLRRYFFIDFGPPCRSLRISNDMLWWSFYTLTVCRNTNSVLIIQVLVVSSQKTVKTPFSSHSCPMSFSMWFSTLKTHSIYSGPLSPTPLKSISSTCILSTVPETLNPKPSNYSTSGARNGSILGM